jgi:methyl-accepting chemotaxis protein
MSMRYLVFPSLIYYWPMLKNLTIKSRLIFVIGFLSVQLIVGAVIGIISLGFANDSMKSLYDDRLVALGQLDQVVRLLNVNQMAVAKAITEPPANVPRSMDGVDSNMQQLNRIWDEYLATYLTPEEKNLANRFTESRKKFVEEGLLPAVAALRTQNTVLATDLLHGPMEKWFAPVRDDINALIKLQLDVAKSDFEKSQSTYLLVRSSCIAGVLFGLLLAAMVGIWLIHAISRPLETAVKIAGGVAAGDLTQHIEVHSTDETGRLMQALKNMNDSLINIVGEVRSGTETIAAASHQIASGNLDLSSRTEEQASSLEETASSMEELTATVKQNADNARQANQLAASASEVASKGGAVVAQVVSTMGSINDSSKKIVDIIAVIDGIAFQTNILALNAAVEAARAGEQGRGFAVVAAEVRNLAQRSAGAAKEIKELINDSVEKVHAGATLVNHAGTTMEEIVDSIRRVTDIMGEIAAASQEQTSGIDQINQAITQMDQVTQQNAALVEEAAAAAEAMQGQAGHLAQAVSVFKIHGMHAAPIAHAPVRTTVVTSTPSANAGKFIATPQPKRIANAAVGEEWEQF